MSSVHWSETADVRRERSSRDEDDEIIPFIAAEPPEPLVSPLVLARLIDGEIIPRLLLAHNDDVRGTRSAIAMACTAAADVEGFVRVVLDEDPGAALDRAQTLLAHGLGVEQIYIDLLSPAARRLGEMWEEDLCSFTDVTIGLCRLQQTVYDLADMAPSMRADQPPHDALFAMAPGDQHAFGLVLVAEFFRRAGWRTVSMPDAERADLIDLVSTRSFDLIGFSLCTVEGLPDLPDLIAALRRASRNPHVRVMVGGRVFSERPALAWEVGADDTAEDARLAVERASRLVQRSIPVA